MTYPTIIHHGAHAGVTGSCHQLCLSDKYSLLVDCGLFQGQEAKGSPEIDFPVGGIAGLVITHAHLDHIGRIPWLLAAGFNGPILCSEPTARLLPIMLEDAFKLMLSRDQARVERYIAKVASRIVSVPYDKWVELPRGHRPKARLRMARAGHVLGSAYVEFDIASCDGEPSQHILFSGDLGSGQSSLLRAPTPPERADVLILESTYGDRFHPGADERVERLERLIEKALADQGTILIPSFSLGRAQELLSDIEVILRKTALLPTGPNPAPNGPVDWPRLPVILDSPLASRITQAYRELQPYWNAEVPARAESSRSPLAFPQLITIDDHEQHHRVVNYLASTLRPAIVIAGNGMCSGGRIVNYLKAMLRHPRHNVLFSGYQAQGTPGAVIQAAEGAEGFVSIDLDGERYDIRAGVATLQGYSAHADQTGLVAFVIGMAQPPRTIRLVHGERSAKAALASALRLACPTTRIEV
ncbi:MBL fold metallo-hydrolase [Pseudomonas sp. DC3000-4b1]|uniref:MBL fold metallo-hydrolase n=1 Tax=unclassified Pseudomonas TaxID=196821 RepID=UPI003CEF6393